MQPRVGRRLHDRIEALPQTIRDIAWKASLLFDPGQRLIGVNVGPRERAVGQTEQTFGNDLFGSVETTKKHTGRLANCGSYHRALGRFEGSPDRSRGAELRGGQ
jgi:hypothetical protein